MADVRTTRVPTRLFPISIHPCTPALYSFGVGRRGSRFPSRFCSRPECIPSPASGVRLAAHYQLGSLEHSTLLARALHRAI